MFIDQSIIQKKLIKIYNSDSSSYAPFAYWKMQKLIEDGQAYYIEDHDCYYVIRNKHLLVYSSFDNQCHIPINELNNLDCISMKASIFDTIKDKLVGFKISYMEFLYFDKSYKSSVDRCYPLNIKDFDFTNPEHFRIAAEIINEHEGNYFKPENIRKMTTFPSFDPTLWFFLENNATGELIGIAISTFQEDVRETDLDWVYIRKNDQGKGAGRLMIDEIIKRSMNRSDVIRVSGTNDFYRKCGFYTKEKFAWAVKPGYSFYAPSIQPNVLL